MPFQVFLLPQAEADIEANASWWATHDSVNQATHWFDTVHAQLKLLTISPESNGLSAENDEFPYEIRDKLVRVGPRPSYRAIFTIKENCVYVLTVQRSTQEVVRPTEVDAPPSE